MISYFSVRVKKLSSPWHAVIIESFDIHHGFGNVVLFLSLFEKSTLIQNSLIDEGFDIFRSEFLFGKAQLVLHIVLPLLKARVFSGLRVFVSDIDRKGFFLALRIFSRLRLFLYQPW